MLHLSPTPITLTIGIIALILIGTLSILTWKRSPHRGRTGVLEVLRMLVYAFYAENFSFRKVVKKYPHLKGDVTDILVGHVDRDFSELTAAMSDFMDVPEPVPHGRAMVPGKEI